jgi:2-dehydro-3-deoxyphosphogluconate aldolase/(4S)-4-hydroxy-2-oxoglutarate aldolase
MSAFDPTLAATIQRAGNIAVLVLDDVAKAVPLANALLDGGVQVLELTLRTPAALEALCAVAREVPEMIVGAGTVLTPEQLAQAADAGAAFAVAPGLNPRVVRAAAERGLSFAPGVMTPSEIEQAVELGCTLLKFFPAGALGGLKTLTTMAAPYQHLGLRYIPLGGLTPETTADYLKSKLVAACGGSWIATSDLIAAGDWSRIRDNARRATEIAASARAS